MISPETQLTAVHALCGLSFNRCDGFTLLFNKHTVGLQLIVYSVNPSTTKINKTITTAHYFNNHNHTLCNNYRHSNFCRPLSSPWCTHQLYQLKKYNYMDPKSTGGHLLMSSSQALASIRKGSQCLE